MLADTAPTAVPRYLTVVTALVFALTAGASTTAMASPVTARTGGTGRVATGASDTQRLLLVVP